MSNPLKQGWQIEPRGGPHNTYIYMCVCIYIYIYIYIYTYRYIENGGVGVAGIEFSRKPLFTNSNHAKSKVE